MTPESFAEHFHILADAPNGVQKLREMILQLAVQGKLVPQDLKDEPATVLLEKIRAEKEKLIRDGKIRKQKLLPPIDPEEVPYELPVSWVWVRLGDVTNYGMGDRVEPGDVADGTWTLELGDIEKTTSRLLVRVCYPEREFKSTKNVFVGGNVLYGKLRPYLDKVLVADEPGVCTTEIIPIHGYGGINSFYLRIALKAPYFVDYANSSTHGMNLPRLGTDKARLAAFALPPLAEQKRIVTNVDQLMALCDELEARQKERAENRITLNGACLNALTFPDGVSTRKAWQRISENFDLLYDCLENVSALRQAILQLAVQGELVSQDPKDEPASVLLEKIRAEREKLIKEGKIRRPKPLPPIDPDEVLYQLPEGWEWVRFGDIHVEAFTGLERARARQSLDRQYAYFKMNNISNDGFTDLSDVVRVNATEGELRKYQLFPGDFLFNTRNSYQLVGKTCVFSPKKRGDFVFNNNVLKVRFGEGVMPDYVHIWCWSISGREYLDKLKSATTNVAAIYQGKLMTLPVPVPPLAEQKRVVEKVDQLMALCGELEAKLKQSESAAETLTNAVVHDLVEVGQ